MVNEQHNLRSTYRAKRRALSQTQQQQASHDLIAQCQPLLSAGQRVAFYLANDGELDPVLLIQFCRDNNIQVYLPVLHPFSPGHLLFHAYHADTIMQANRFGIPEPVIHCQQICPLKQLDIIFTPLVAFDASGNRLGMGGGFYDRTLKPIARDGLSTRLIGLAHDCQQADNLPVQPWDIPLTKIITPTKIFCA
ncbi:5-formyltetrahydrofolate cyclo-ligase [Neptunicella sp. SCSIO 80796]|uniref:5-formyltetrahydrofolate cyclo-ligase n=1 Tax=Neptunicella plasticusilytica TaxID=3117012 RepID=UPI003A4DC425